MKNAQLHFVLYEDYSRFVNHANTFLLRKVQIDVEIEDYEKLAVNAMTWCCLAVVYVSLLAGIFVNVKFVFCSSLQSEPSSAEI